MFSLYIKLLILCNFKRTCTNMAESAANEISHDRLNRLLYLAFEGKKHLEKLAKLKNLKGGYFMIDDTVIEKPHSKCLEGGSFVYSSSLGKAVFGYQLVLLVWTDGKQRIIVDQRIYQKGGKSKIDLALDMLSYARNQLSLKPEFVLFDSWYASKRMFKRISQYGWFFCTRIKKNRLFNGQKLKDFKKNPYWNEVGRLGCGLKVRIIRNGKKYFATNRLSLARSEVMEIYRIRQNIEEVNKELKFIGIKDCQARSIKAQNQHIWFCILAFSFVEKESRAKKITVYKYLKQANSRADEVGERLLSSLSKVA